MYWLYSMPNLLTFQQLDTLYLGGNHVRVVCERVWRIQVCEHSKRFLRLATCQNATCVKHARSWRVTTAGALQNKKGQSGLVVISWLKLATHSSSEWVTRTPYFAKKYLFIFLTYPTINTLIPMKCKELSKRILREKP